MTYRYHSAFTCTDRLPAHILDSPNVLCILYETLSTKDGFRQRYYKTTSKDFLNRVINFEERHFVAFKDVDDELRTYVALLGVRLIVEYSETLISVLERLETSNNHEYVYRQHRV